MKSYDVTIQMKAPCLYLHMVLFVFQNVRKWTLEIWSKFAFNYVWQWKGEDTGAAIEPAAWQAPVWVREIVQDQLDWLNLYSLVKKLELKS